MGRQNALDRVVDLAPNRLVARQVHCRKIPAGVDSLQIVGREIVAMPLHEIDAESLHSLQSAEVQAASSALSSSR